MVEKEGRPFPSRADGSADIEDEEKELRQASDPVLPVPPPVAAMESELLALVTVAPTEMVIHRPTLSVQVQNGDSTTTITKERKLDFDLKLSVLLITLSMIPLTDILFLHGPTAKLYLTLKLSAFFAFIALTSAICLMFQTFKLKAVVNPEQFITRSRPWISPARGSTRSKSTTAVPLDGAARSSGRTRAPARGTTAAQPSSSGRGPPLDLAVLGMEDGEGKDEAVEAGGAAATPRARRSPDHPASAVFG